MKIPTEDTRTEADKQAAMDRFFSETPHSPEAILTPRERDPITLVIIDDDPDE